MDEKKKNIIKIVIAAVILITVISLIGSYFTNKYNQNNIFISGTVETVETDLSFQVPGKIILNIPQEGDDVKKGQLLAKLDDKDLLYQMQQTFENKKTYLAQVPQLKTRILTSQIQQEKQLSGANSQVLNAKLRYKSALLGSRQQDILRTKAAMTQARKNLDYFETDLKRNEALFNDSAIPRQLLDQSRNAYCAAKGQYEQAKETYLLAKEGPLRKEDIQATGTQVTQAQSNYDIVKTQTLETKQLIQQLDILDSQIKQADAVLKQAQVQLSHTKLISPIDATVLVRAKEPGEVVSSGTTILTIANINNVYLKAYVPEPMIGKIKYGERVEVKTDSFPNKTYSGKIYYISKQAEFTPKNLTTKEDRVKQVFMIKISLDNENQELKPGMIADGMIKVGNSK